MLSKKQCHRKILLLEYFTIAWNIVEGIVSITIGIVSGSVSLLAFGLESNIEVFSSVVTVWELKGVGNKRRRSALKMISWALIAVAIFITLDAVRSFFEGHRPTPTVAGMAFMLLVTVIMFIVGSLKRNLGRKMNNPVILAESNFTLMDSGLSGSILCGLILNATLGWWWVDQILALFIAVNAFRQGVKGIDIGFRLRPPLFINRREELN
jgi:divalent metal cation (Fe/Co/Zn/Cd) transporter